MTDHLADTARLEAELELSRKRDTAPAPPMSSLPPRTDEDTGPISQSDRIKAAAAIAVRDAVDEFTDAQMSLQLAQYRVGEALGMAADDEARRTPTRLQRIEEKLDTLLERHAEFLDHLTQANQRLVVLETWKKLHSNRCSDCPRNEVEAEPELTIVAQEGE